MFGLTGYDILGWVLFGGVGMIACAWGKLKDRWQPWVLGVALMIYPYFIPGGPLLWGLGTVLAALAFLAKR